MKTTLFIFPVLLSLLFLSGCGGGGDSDNQTAEEIYQSSDAIDKFDTSNKLLNTLFKGVDPSRFFRSGDRVSLESASAEYAPEAIKTLLDTPLDSRAVVFQRIDEYYAFDNNAKPLQYPITTLFEMPLSQDYFRFWMAYVLSNTILFSPAVELDSVDIYDAQRVYHRLVNMMDESSTISRIVYEHMISQENWRRFRSPEDNTREMMEIFLGRFIDAEVPKASKACQNWYLTDDGEGYQLVKTLNVNEESQAILDTEVTTCEEFYQAVADHADLMPQIIKILVDYFYDGRSAADKQRIVASLAGKGYRYFDDLFKAIIFSRSYLYETERSKKYEELFLGMADTISWYPTYYYFRDLNRQPSSTSLETLLDMNQGSMRYKLGRFGAVPVDSLSFSYVHKAVRDRLFLDRRTNEFSIYDGGWRANFITDVTLEEDQFIDYYFVALAGRMPTEEERTALEEIFTAEGIATNKEQRVVVMMDYISRLSELYYFR